MTEKTLSEPELTPPPVIDTALDNAVATEAAHINADATTDESAAKGEEVISVTRLQQQLSQAHAQVQEHWDTILRQQAEQENLRRRMSREVEQAHKYALERFASELLAVRDSLEMGLDAAQNAETSIESLREGNDLILKMLITTMNKFEIKEINPLGQKFDPHIHEAMATAPDPNVEPNTVLMVHQKGYQLHERLLRPARVIVAKAP
jgi:molecular chaperone GrpE